MPQFAKNTEPFHWALIGDIVGSTDLPSRARAELQRTLKTALADLSGQQRASLDAPLAITAGDEFEGLYHNPAAAFETARILADELFPTMLRFGLGRGPLATPLHREWKRRSVAELDGPAFHRARAAVERARESELWFTIDLGQAATDARVLESLAELLSLERHSWTDKQATTVAMARHSQQIDIADELGVSKSVISERLKAARFDACLRAEDAIMAGLTALQRRLAD